MIFAEVLDKAGVPAGVFNLVHGDGPGVGAALSTPSRRRHGELHRIDPRRHRRGAGTPRRPVKRVHQELGGKSPNLVLEGADLARRAAADRIGGVLRQFGPELHRADAPAGPCLAGSRMRRRSCKTMMEATQVGDPSVMGAHIGPVVNKAQYEKIQGLIQSGDRRRRDARHRRHRAAGRRRWRGILSSRPCSPA